MVIDIFALIVIGILLGFVIWLVVKLGPLPGRIARGRGHPQADAVNVLSWIGVITLGIAWPFALVWAHLRPSGQQDDDLGQRVTALESELAALKNRGGET
jgi:heme/copper-type cytochrome/quinol oxidase subunit 1